MECGKVFGSNPESFELLKTYLAMFLRTSSLKRLNSFRAADISDLIEKGILVVANEGGRSTNYLLKEEL